MSLKWMLTYLHVPVTQHKKADPLVAGVSKRMKIAALLLKMHKALINFMGVNTLGHMEQRCVGSNAKRSDMKQKKRISCYFRSVRLNSDHITTK